VEGIRRILERIFNKPIIYGQIDPTLIQQIRMGTTVATNALLERKGAKSALLITQGFESALEIGYQNRPKLFELNIQNPSLLYEKVVEIEERVVVSQSGLVVEKALDNNRVKNQLQELKNEGFESIAVVLMHAYGVDKHEKMIKKLALEVGFENVSISCEVMPSIKLIDRGDTTVVDAYLTPHIQAYIESFQKGFSSPIPSQKLLFMQSHGGLSEASHFSGANSLLSGPAGGVSGYGESFDTDKPLIGFDMGGTSSDVSRYENGVTISYENEIDNIKIKTPQIEILTVAAGGGSRLFYKNGLFVVGPESSGAAPGPVCYKKGGYLSITDANLVLGRIQPDYFPKIFGANQDEPLGYEESYQAFEALARIINAQNEKKLTIEEIALGFLEVANENMSKPIREVSTQKGYDIASHALCAFGGAGGQHAVAIARTLGMGEIFIHRYSGILSAYGLNVAQRRVRKQSSLNRLINEIETEFLQNQIEELQKASLKAFTLFDNAKVEHKATLGIKYQGSEHQIFVDVESDWQEAFETEHQREFGFLLDKELEVVDLIVETIIDEAFIKRVEEPISTPSKRVDRQKVYFKEGWMETPIYQLSELEIGEEIKAPAIIMNETSTILIEPNSKATILPYRDIKITLLEETKKSLSTNRDPIQLAIFNNQFMSIAQIAGNALQKTAVSTNIKERLDFSCALFDANGNLIANAPHIPVHLGAMSHTVRAIKAKFSNIQSGESFITNDPSFGGSHLPDITVITPYVKDGKIEFWAANRGHHADIGGVVPGSMPPFSTHISQEGALIHPMRVVEKGVFQEEKLRAIFTQSKARKMDENISDIKAQILSNQKAIGLMCELFSQYSKEVVQSYMAYLQEVSVDAVEKLLDARVKSPLSAVDYLDDGSQIVLNIYKTSSRSTSPEVERIQEIESSIGIPTETDGNEGAKYIFDFSASAMQSFYNQNAPSAITSSAIIYVLRTLLNEDLPLNEGFLKPIRIILPKDSLLNPSSQAAVAGGNVTTSQRIVDVLLRAFGECGASSGCMNNFSFGNEEFGYYETIAGGSGAGEGYDGASGVHTHMTNTKITDSEILEHRYPVIVREFGLRHNSGGKGKYCGGDGVVREIEFREKVNVSLITERRAIAPWGAKGGGDGSRGENILKRNGKSYHLSPKASLEVQKGESIIIKTPSGGGYGQ
jgi:5-oxoprolinase (ATP-hydrolysing)